jgi:fructose-bisphosphate aldolase class II
VLDGGLFMSIVTAKAILTPRPEGWAIGAFNVHNLEDVQAVVWAAEKSRAPVILMVSESALKYAGAPYISSIARVAAEQTEIPIALQLDHGHSPEIALECMRLGFSAVMIDGSHLGFRDNVALTRKVVEMAKDFGVSVEGELGRIGGKEDDTALSAEEASLADPARAAEFVEATGIDLLAPAIGTVHGFYRREPRLDVERLKVLRSTINVPLVLHGGSDLPPPVIESVIALGVAKINVGTDLKYAITSGVRDFLLQNPAEYEPRRVFAAGRARAEQLVMERLALFGSVGRAGAWAVPAT